MNAQQQTTIIDYLPLALAIADRQLQKLAPKTQKKLQPEIHATAHAALTQASFHYQKNNFRAYARKYIRNQVIDTIKKELTKPKAKFWQPDEQPSHEISIDHAEEKTARCRQLIQSLPENYRQTMQLIYQQGLSQTEVAQQTGLAPSWISDIHKQSIKILKEIYA